MAGSAGGFPRIARVPRAYGCCEYESSDEGSLAFQSRFSSRHDLKSSASASLTTLSSSHTLISTTASSIGDIVKQAKSMNPSRKVGIRDRIGCYQWTWFTMTMATGGVANALYSIPVRTKWLLIIGTIFYFFNIYLFLQNCVLISLRFYWRPRTFFSSFTDQMESLFVPSFFVSLGIILMTTCQYGLPIAPRFLFAMEVFFWIYIGLSMFASAGMYLILWSTQVFPIHTMTPVWVFPAYPLLLCAPFAANLIGAASSIGQLASINAVAVTLAAVTAQGTGFLIAFMICAAFLYRLMTQKLPRDAQRPSMFISIGPSGFTAGGIVRLGYQAADIFPDDFVDARSAVFILQIMSFMVGLWLYGLCIWFFLVSSGSLWKYVLPEHRNKMPFQMTWFSFVFPNTAMVGATCELSKAFANFPLMVLGCVLAGMLVFVWFVVFVYMLRALWRRQLLWPKEAE